MSVLIDLVLERGRRHGLITDQPGDAGRGTGLAEFIKHEDLLRRMVQSLWCWLVFVDRETAAAVLVEAGFSEYEVARFADRAFALLLVRRRVSRGSAR